MLPLKKDVKLVRSLHQKKFRNESGLFIVEGRKMVDEALNSHFRPHSLYTTDQHFAHAMPEAILATQREMEMMSTLATASQHLAVLYQNNETFKNLQSEQMILVLDGISDPGNMGTMLRNADWFGVRQVLCTNDCVELYNPKVVQSTMGSIFRVRVMYSEVSEILDMLRKSQFGIAGAVMNGESLYESAFAQRTALIIGSESHGLRPEMIQALESRITIPRYGKAESLNASVACAILLAEWKRSAQ